MTPPTSIDPGDPAHSSSAASARGEALRWMLVFGLLAGLGEGAGLLETQRRGLANWWPFLSVTQEILWISPAVDLALFGIVGLVLALAVSRARPATAAALAILVGTLLLVYDWMRITNTVARSRASLVALLVAIAAAALARWRARLVLATGRRALRWLLALVVLLALCLEIGGRLRERVVTARLPEPPPHARNVLVLLVDTLRADHCGFLGAVHPTTPHVDRLAAEGCSFTDAYSAAPWTLPSHASLLTGRYAYEHGATIYTLDERYPTLPEILARAGWRTGAISANPSFFSRRRGLDRGFLHFEDCFFSLASRAQKSLLGREIEHVHKVRFGGHENLARRDAQDVNASLLAWLDGAHGRPFFAFLNYFDAHDPYLPPEPWRSRFSQRPGPGGRISSGRGLDYKDFTKAELAEESDAYDGAIAYVDDRIGALLKELDARGLLKETLVVFTSDHGESFGEHGFWLHRGCLYREQIRVPLVLWAPGLVPAGRKIDLPVSNVSLAATLLDLLGLPPESDFVLPSLSPLLRADDPIDSWPDPLAEIARHPWFEYRTRPVHTGEMRVLVHGSWHLIRHEKRGDELYDVASDPAELKNRIDDPSAPVALTRHLLESALARQTPHPNVKRSAEGSERRKEVEGLGYVGGDGH